MNWQLIKNVNPPRSKALELYFQDYDSIQFAERSEDGESIEIGKTFYDGEVSGDEYRMSYEKFKKYFGSRVFWTLLVKP